MRDNQSATPTPSEIIQGYRAARRGVRLARPEEVKNRELDLEFWRAMCAEHGIQIDETGEVMESQRVSQQLVDRVYALLARPTSRSNVASTLNISQSAAWRAVKALEDRRMIISRPGDRPREVLYMQVGAPQAEPTGPAVDPNDPIVAAARLVAEVAQRNDAALLSAAIACLRRVVGP
ncbi:MAG: hypothetical protein KGS10_05730 [Chloroflexi bacterium]|nr:hypothetical protein [Chloroflexota bacterium]